MADKDNWDKFEIIFKAIILGVIPLIIKLGTDNIAQSLKRGELVSSLIADLTQPDTKRDVALIALDAAIQKDEQCTILWKWGCQNNTDQDQVLDIAMVLVNNSIDDAREKGQSPKELEVAKQIIIKRASETFYENSFGAQYRNYASDVQRQVISNVDQNKELSPGEIASKANTSKTLAALQPSQIKTDDNTTNNNESLAGIRLVYIQYGSNKELAENLQSELQNKDISAPGIEKVAGIKQNSIRYANVADRQMAEKLQSYIQKNQSIQIEQIINLSTAGYRVPSGQFEVWLK